MSRSRSRAARLQRLENGLLLNGIEALLERKSGRNIRRIAARLAGVPVIVHTTHGWGFNSHQPPHIFWLYVWLERLCVRFSRVVIVVGSPNQTEGLSLGIGRPEQYRLIRSGIEIGAYRDVALSKAEARTRLGIPTNAFVIGSVGRLGEQKAPLDLLTAFIPVARSHANAHLVFVGDGPHREPLESAIAAAGLGDRERARPGRHPRPGGRPPRVLLRGVLLGQAPEPPVGGDVHQSLHGQLHRHAAQHPAAPHAAV